MAEPPWPPPEPGHGSCEALFASHRRASNPDLLRRLVGLHLDRKKLAGALGYQGDELLLCTGILRRISRITGCFRSATGERSTAGQADEVVQTPRRRLGG